LPVEGQGLALDVPGSRHTGLRAMPASLTPGSAQRLRVVPLPGNAPAMPERQQRNSFPLQQMTLQQQQDDDLARPLLLPSTKVIVM